MHSSREGLYLAVAVVASSRRSDKAEIHCIAMGHGNQHENQGSGFVQGDDGVSALVLGLRLAGDTGAIEMGRRLFRASIPGCQLRTGSIVEKRRKGRHRCRQSPSPSSGPFGL